MEAEEAAGVLSGAEVSVAVDAEELVDTEGSVDVLVGAGISVAVAVEV